MADLKVQECVKLILESRHLAVLTGAGISTSAGIPDFRGPQGLYVTRQYDPDKVFDIGYFYRDPRHFFEFARDFVKLEERIKPTPAHFFLAKLEREGYIKGIITQNIDALHQKAGSQNVFEMHGSIWKSHCIDCDKEFDYEEMKEKVLKEDVAHCSCGGVIKPDIVFFGENVKFLEESTKLAEMADVFFIIGTSCVVFPAAMIPHYVTGKIVVVNQTPLAANFENTALTVQEDIDRFFQEVNNEIFHEN